MEISPDKPNNIDITSVSEIHKRETRREPKTSIMEDFLSSYEKKGTMRMYKRGIELYAQWCGKDLDAILAERKNDLTPRSKESFVEAKQRANRAEKALESFHKWLLEKGYKLNSARTLCLGILQLYRYHAMSVVLRNGSPINATEVSIGDFVLLPEHIRAMFHAAKDLRSKLFISMGNDLGWRISDIIAIRRDGLPNLEQEPPIEWDAITIKKRKIGHTCLSKTTVALLKEYLFDFPTKNPFLFNHNSEGHIAEETVNARLRDLARDANVEFGNKKLHWHCFRKMVISVGKNLSVDPDILNLMVGRAVRKDVETYMTGVKIKKAFNKLQEELCITTLTEQSEDQVKTLTTQIDDLQKQLEAIKTLTIGLFGLSRQQVEEYVVKMFGGKEKVLRGDVGPVRVKDMVARMSDKALLDTFLRFRRQSKQHDFDARLLSDIVVPAKNASGQ